MSNNRLAVRRGLWLLDPEGGGLEGKEFGVKSMEGNQLAMVPMLDHASLTKGVDVVGLPDSCEAVRYEHDGAPAEKVT